MLFSVRGGGHNVTGSAVADDGLMLDLSGMKAITSTRRAHRGAEPGCLWSDLDAATQEFGLAVTGGQASDTGIAGLTLGGGVGQLMRSCGATVDSLSLGRPGHRRRPAAHRAPPTSIRTCSGPCVAGAATSASSPRSTTDCTPSARSSSVGCSSIRRAATALLAHYRDWMPDAPDELERVDGAADGTTRAVRPPGAATAAGGRRARSATSATSTPARELIAPLIEAFPPAADLVAPMPYTVHQQLNDPGTPWGRQVYLKSANLKELSDPVIEIITRYAAEVTSPMTMVPLNAWGGAISRVAEDATAFGHRDTKFTIYIFAMWARSVGRASRHIEWARAFHDALRPHMNGIYVNEMGPEERIHDAYPARHPRPARRGEDQIRPDQLLPDEPEHQTGELISAGRRLIVSRAVRRQPPHRTSTNQAPGGCSTTTLRSSRAINA